MGLGVPNNMLTCMQGKKKKKKQVHFILLICIYFYIICSMNNFSKPLLCMKLICSDWSILFNAAFVSVAVFVSVTAYNICVQRYQGNSYLLTIQKLHLVAKNYLAFSFRPMWKSSFPRSARTTSERAICNYFMLMSTWNSLGFILKMTRLNDSESTLSFETIALYTVHFQIKNFTGCFHSLEGWSYCWLSNSATTVAELHTEWKVIFKNP